MAMAMAMQQMLPLPDLRVRSPASCGSWSGVVRASCVLNPRPQRIKRILVQVRAASGVETSTSSSSASKKEIIQDTEITITKPFTRMTLENIRRYGFGAYFTVLPGSEISALMLTYGFPLTIIGMALKYAELKPVPNITYADAFALRQSQSTDILNQVRNDVTRFRYGDEQHLDEALKKDIPVWPARLLAPVIPLGLKFEYDWSYNTCLFFFDLLKAKRTKETNAGGIQRRNAPKLQSIREEVTGDNKYTLVLVFEAKALTLGDFEQRQAKFTSFFGPGIKANISAGKEPNIIEVALVSDGGPQAAASTS